MNRPLPTMAGLLVLSSGCLCFAAGNALAQWDSILKPPDYKKIYKEQDKVFTPRQFDAQKSFPLKPFPGEKIVEKPVIPTKNFKACTAPADSRLYPIRNAADGSKTFPDKGWTSAKDFPVPPAPQLERVSPLESKSAPLPELPKLGPEYKPPPTLTEEQARKLLQQLYGSPSAK